jgi:large repetitive protein
MSVNLSVPNQPGVSFNRNVTQKMFLTLLLTVLAAMPLWLGLEHVHSAPSGIVSSAPPMPPTVSTFDVPAEVLIGEQFTFTVKFKNTAGAVGFGPSLDLVLDGGANVPKSPGPCACDGITFVKAEMVEVNGGPIDVTPPPSSQIKTSPCGTTANTNVTHPFGPFATSGIQPLTVPPGAELVTIELPFGSFDSTQPDIVVRVTAQLSSLADYNVPLKVSARSFFRYGADPQNNPVADHPIFSDENPPGTQVTNSAQWIAQATTTPKVMTAKKEYDFAEDETATGPNYPHNYKITVDIANGQSITNLKVHDFLPNNMQYQAGVVVKIHGILATQGRVQSA